MVTVLGTKGRVAALRGCVSPLLLGAVVLGAGDAWAVSPTDELQNAFAEVGRLLGDPETEAKPEERLIAVRQIVRRLFDFHEAAQAALGPQWRARTARERQEFVQLFGSLLERAYVSRVASSTTLAGEGSIAYLEEVIEGNRALVSTAMASKRGGTVALEYWMRKRGDGWVVTDVVVDGISLVANYQAQFTRVIQASSYGELVERMRAKASPDGGPAGPAASSAAVSATAPLAEPPFAATETPARPASGATQTAATPFLAEPPIRTPARDESIAPAGIAPNTGVAPPAEVSSPTVEIAKAAVTMAAPSPRAGSGASAATGNAPGETLLAASGPSPIAVATSARTYWVQVGAFRNAETAWQLTERLRQQKFPAKHQRGAELTRVRVGPLRDRAQVVSTLRLLEAKGYRPFVAPVRD